MRKIYVLALLCLNAFFLDAQTITYGGSFSPFFTTEAVASTSQSIDVTAANFGACTDLEITPPIGFEVSIDNVSFLATTITIPKSNDSVIATIYVRLAAGTVGVPSGVFDMRGCAGATLFSGPPLNVDGTICIGVPPNAGGDMNECSSLGFVNVTGSGAPGGVTETWTTSGTGTFNNPNIASTDYNFSPLDIISGFVTLTYELSSPGCAPQTDDVTITILPSPTVSGGGIQQHCASTPFVNLSMGSTASNHQWTQVNAAGILSNATALDPIYTVSPTDVSNGSAILEFSSSDGTCADRDTVTLIFNPDPVVSAPADNTVCENVASYNLVGSVPGGVSVTWTTTGTGSFTDPNTATTDYTFSPADISAGFINFSITGIDIVTGCAANDQVNIFTQTVPTVNAGTDQTLCGSVQTINLSGSVSSGSSSWASLGSGTFLNISVATTDYTPGPVDKANGYATLVLTGQFGACSEDDTVTITLQPAPAVSIGADKHLCSSTAPVALFSSMQNATGVLWASSGTGTFSPSIAFSNPSYSPSMDDTLQPSITISIQTTGNGICPAGTDTLKIFYIQPGVVNAGPDLTLCGKEIEVSGAIVSNGTPFVWQQISGPTVSIKPDSITPQPLIIFASDSTAGTINLTLSDLGGCGSTDTVTITKSFTGLPAADFSSKRIVTTATAGIDLGITAIGNTPVWQLSGTGNIGGTGPYFYTPSTQDLSDGYVEIVANVQGTSGCTSYFSSDTIYLVLANPVNLHEIQGTLNGSNFRVVLSKLLNDFWVPIVDTIFPTTSFTIPGLPDGEYKVQVFPNGGAFTSAYYGGTQDWRGASTITISGGNVTGIDVTLPSLSVPVDTLAKYFGGNDKIVGRIMLNVLGTITNLRTTDATSNKPVAGANVVVSNSSGSSKLSTTTTDEDGFYEVDNLNANSMTITVEYPGTVVEGTTISNANQNQPVTTDGDEDPTEKNVSVVRIDEESAGKLVNIADPISFKDGSILFPNPAKDKVFVNIPTQMRTGNYHVQVLDATGKSVLSESLSTNLNMLQVNVADLNEGMYYVRITSGRLQTIEKLIVE